MVRVEGGEKTYTLPPRNDIRNHSPTGFEWSYSGSGPAQLALALLIDACGLELAQEYYQDFKFRVVIHLQDHWEMTQEEIEWSIGALMQERRISTA